MANFLDTERILYDIKGIGVEYPDMGIFDDFEFGGTANLRIPFETLRFTSVWPSTNAAIPFPLSGSMYKVT